MNSLTIPKANGALIPCLEEIPRDPKGVVIVAHGFTSSKESSTGAVLMKTLPPAGIGVIAYDHPGHGDSEEELRMANCVESLAAIEADLRVRFPQAAIYYFGSSFGAYTTLLYVSTRPHFGRRAVLRSAAVKMPALLLGDDLSGPARFIREELDRDGYTEPDLNLGGIVRIPAGFFEDLRENDVFEICAVANAARGTIAGTAFAMAHARGDEVVPFAAAERFSGQFGIPLTVFENEHHTLSDQPETPEKVAALALAFFDGPAEA